MSAQAHFNVIPGRSAAGGKGIHHHVHRDGSPFLAFGSPGMTGVRGA